MMTLGTFPHTRFQSSGGSTRCSGCLHQFGRLGIAVGSWFCRRFSIVVLILIVLIITSKYSLDLFGIPTGAAALFSLLACQPIEATTATSGTIRSSSTAAATGTATNRQRHGPVILRPFHLAGLSHLDGPTGHRHGLGSLHPLPLHPLGGLLLLRAFALHPPAVRLLPRQQGRIALDVRDVPAPLRLLHDAFARLADVLDKVRQRRPLGAVHVDVIPVLDDLLVHVVGIHLLGAVPPAEGVHVGLLEFRRETVEELACVFGKYLHLSEVRVGREVTFEAVLVAALLVAHLAVELELLKALGLHFVGDILRGTPLGLRHGWMWCSVLR
mmetsp:Transcript_19825/g.56973  ORF Transcript_19825/g.56973 Transcript_19825/m.56973 type:complete len:327 (-) Transcript_19825:241-1221(-)